MVINLKTKNNSTQTNLWFPKQVLITPDADAEEWGQQILKRIKSYDIPIKKLTQNKITGLRGQTERETYALAKNTLAIVNAPSSQFKLSPIPPSADWQFHIAQGCPAHCQYCYLAGSLSGVPVVKVYANLTQILANLSNLVIAPIMAIADWQKHCTNLFELLQNTFDFDCDLTLELITHRFTPKSKEVLQTWYPKSKLNLEEENRSRKYNKFGGVKYVYEKEIMAQLKEFIETKIADYLPQATILYWT
jgi:DNA repair photolyase